MKKHFRLDWLQEIVSLGSLITAIVAIILALNSESRNAERFKKQLQEADRIAQAQVKPLLSIRTQVYLNNKSVILSNRGIGAAIITKIEMSRNGNIENNLAALFYFKSKVVWDDFYKFGKRTYLSVGEEIKLASLTYDNLIAQGKEPEEATEILSSFEYQRKKIDIHIEYLDILGNEQIALDW